MGMFGMFGKKRGGSGGGDEEFGGDMVSMMKMMAGMPGMMRKPMMKGRINQLLALSEEKRQESIRDMMGAFHSPDIKAKTRETLVATRVEIISEMPEEKRRTIMSSRAAALKIAPELDQVDQKVQQQVLTQLSPQARNTFTASWDYVKKASSSN